MKSILEEIYYGECGNYENFKASDEYWKINKEYNKVYESLEKDLNEEQKNLLDELFVQGGGLEGAMACAHFKEGFKMGMLIAIETLT